MKQVVFVTPNLANGGAERVTAVLANAICRDGVPVTVAYIKDDHYVYPVDNDVNQVYLFGKGPKPVRIFKKILNLRRLMKEKPQAAYVAMLSFEMLYTYFAAIGLHRNIIFYLSSDPNAMNTSAARFVIKYLFPRATRIVFQTPDAMNYFPETVRKKGIVVPNPISENLMPRFEGERKKEFVAVGRFTEAKNYPMLLKAFRIVHDAYPEWKLRIFGKGELEDMLKALATEFDLNECVEFAGFSDHVIEEINQSGGYVMSSDFEGISNAMLEALVTGVPSVVTDCPVGGARMYIEHGVNGLLTPVGDAEKMARAMMEVIQNPAEAEERAKRAVAIREKLAPEVIAQTWKDLL